MVVIARSTAADKNFFEIESALKHLGRKHYLKGKDHDKEVND